MAKKILICLPLAATAMLLYLYFSPNQRGLETGSEEVSSLAEETQPVGKPRVLIIGDSLTEGYGLSEKEAFPSLLQTKMRQKDFPDAAVINAGTSGATSAFCLRTLRFQTKHMPPDHLLVALGANDALRGVTPSETERNLARCLEFAKEKGIRVTLIGMMAPPNYGIKFPEEFSAIYPRLKDRFGVHFIPFLLEGVAGEPRLNLPDGIHPNKQGYEVVAQHVWGFLKGHLR